MFRLGTALRVSACVALMFSATACFKFTPEVTALPSELDTGAPPPATRYKHSGYFSASSGRASTSANSRYKLRGSLDRTSAARQSSAQFSYSVTTSPSKTADGNGGTL